MAGAHENERALMTQVRPNPVAAPTGMVAPSPPGVAGDSYVDEFGATIYPVSYNFLTQTSAGDRGETIATLTSTPVVLSGSTYTHELKVSDHTLGPIEFKLTITGTGATVLSWLVNGRASGDSGTGASYQPGEYYFENYGTAQEVFGNPTRDGQTAFPFTPHGEPVFPYVAYPERDTRVHSGRPLYYSASGETFESACNPMDFMGDLPPWNGASVAGDTATKSNLWYGHRLHQKIRLRWGSTDAVRAVTHRVDNWSYAPTAWNSTNQLLGRFMARYVKPGYFNECKVYDMADFGSPMTLGGFAQAVGVDNFNFYNIIRGVITTTIDISAVNTGTETFSVLGSHGLVVDDIVRFDNIGGTPPGGLTVATNYFVLAAGLTATDFRVTATLGSSTPVNLTTTGTGTTRVTRIQLRAASKYSAVVFRNTTTDVAIALVLKLPLADRSTDTVQPYLGPCGFVVVANFWDQPIGTGAITEPYAVHLDANSNGFARKRGWIGSTEYCCVGLTAHVLAAAQALYAAGDLDLVEHTLPAAVTAGTIWPPPADVLPESTATIRPSEHSNEHVLLKQVRALIDEAPTGYTCEQVSKTVVDDFGVEQHPPASASMLAASPGNKDTETVLQTVVVQGTRTYTNRIVSSNRRGMPVSWTTTIVDSVGPVTITKSWLSVGSSPVGNEAGMQLVEQRNERWNDTVRTAQHLPSQGGAAQLTNEVDQYGVTRLFSGLPVYYSASGSIHEFCCHWLDRGSSSEATFKGDDEQSPVCWWMDRCYQKVQLNWRGSAVIHRVDYASYTPTAWVGSGMSSPQLFFRTAVNECVAAYFGEAFFVDLAAYVPPSTGVFPLSDFILAAPPTAYAGTWDFSSSGLRSASPVSNIFVPLTLSSYLGCALVNSPANFAVAFVAKVAPLASAAAFTAAAVGSPSYISLRQNQRTGATGAVDESSSVGVSFVSQSLGARPQGWIQNTVYVLAGTSADVAAALLSLYASGDLDLPPEQNPAAAAVAGTIWPPGSARPRNRWLP